MTVLMVDQRTFDGMMKTLRKAKLHGPYWIKNGLGQDRLKIGNIIFTPIPK